MSSLTAAALRSRFGAGAAKLSDEELKRRWREAQDLARLIRQMYDAERQRGRQAEEARCA